MGIRAGDPWGEPFTGTPDVVVEGDTVADGQPAPVLRIVTVKFALLAQRKSRADLYCIELCDIGTGWQQDSMARKDAVTAKLADKPVIGAAYQERNGFHLESGRGEGLIKYLREIYT